MKLFRPNVLIKGSGVLEQRSNKVIASSGNTQRGYYWALGNNLRTFLMDTDNALEFERLLKSCA
jgi:hypothetical protein